MLLRSENHSPIHHFAPPYATAPHNVNPPARAGAEPSPAPLRGRPFWAGTLNLRDHWDPGAGSGLPRQCRTDFWRELGLPLELLVGAGVRRAVGCPQCSGTGYHGRVAVYEVMPVTEQIEHLMSVGAPAHTIEEQAIAEGMDTLAVAAARRVAAGTTTVAELVRAIV